MKYLVTRPKNINHDKTLGLLHLFLMPQPHHYFIYYWALSI